MTKERFIYRRVAKLPVDKGGWLFRE